MAAGDFEDAFPELFRLAYRVAFRVVGSPAEAEGIAQETLTRALARWGRVRDHAGPWVATVALRLGLDETRRVRRHPAALLVDLPGLVEDVDRRVDLERALRRLPRRQQQVLACRYLAGLPDEETARLLGVSPGTVKQHAARGLSALRGALGPATVGGPRGA